MYKTGFTFLLMVLLQSAFAQIPRGGNILQNRGGNKAGADTSGKRDNLGFEQRDDAKDSITISYRFLDSIRSVKLDTAINDFYNYFSEPSTQQYLGNNGAAGYPIIFTPLLKPGWDAGFHAFDIYKFTLKIQGF